jgi:hypothetical protein
VTITTMTDPTRRGPRFAYIIPDAAGSIYFDAIISETHSNKSELTEHPVELGSDVTDNIRHDPESFTLEGIVSNTPTLPGPPGPVGSYPGAGWTFQDVQLTIPKPPLQLSLAGLASAGLSALGSLLFGEAPTIAHLITPPGPLDAIAAVHNALTAVERAGMLCTVFTSTKEYDSMAIVAVDMPRERLGSANFRVEFKRVNIVATSTVAAPTPKILAPVASKAAGPQTPKPMTSAEKQSLLSQAVGGIASTLAGGG